MEDASELTPSLTIYIDEAGDIEFSLPEPGEKKAVAVVAVGANSSDAAALRAILPKSEGGTPIKSTHIEFTEEKATAFARDLIASPANVGAFLVDTGCPQSIELARKRTEQANMGRKQARDSKTPGKHPDIGQHDLHYIDFVWKALYCCLHAIARHSKGALPSFFDVVLHRQSIKKHQKKWFQREFIRLADKHGITVRRLSWQSDKAEPFIMLPDVFGGILSRAHRGGTDAYTAANLLHDAANRGRFEFENNPPSEKDQSAK